MKENGKIMSKFKKLVFSFFAICLCFCAVAETYTMRWLNEDGTVNQTTTCDTGEDIILPTAPTKPGYTFVGWTRDFIPLLYLESNGSQYINTGYQYTDNRAAHIIIDVAIFASSGWRVHGVSGSSHGGPNIGISNSGFLGFASNGDVSSGVIGIIGQRYLFDLNLPLGTFKVTEKDNIIVDMKGLTTTYNNSCNVPFYLFGYYTGGSSIKNSSRIYSAKLYDNDILVRDMIPVLDKDGTPCMYDKVTKQYFYNSGSGDFIAGPMASLNIEK